VAVTVLTHRKRRRFLVLLGLLLISPAGAFAAKIHLEVTRQNDTFDVRAEADIDADPIAAWGVLTDYDRLAKFIPGMQESKVVSRTGSTVIVDQRGDATLPFLTFPMRARLEIQEHPFESVVSNAISGNFKDLHGEYHLKVAGTGMVLHFNATFTPDFSFPPLLGTLIVRSAAHRRFAAMVAEIEKTRRAVPMPAAK
jgi:ribosome-associated toxin RatA of RatAB toxin-antitoxin module